MSVMVLKYNARMLCPQVEHFGIVNIYTKQYKEPNHLVFFITKTEFSTFLKSKQIDVFLSLLETIARSFPRS